MITWTIPKLQAYFFKEREEGKRGRERGTWEGDRYWKHKNDLTPGRFFSQLALKSEVATSQGPVAATKGTAALAYGNEKPNSFIFSANNGNEVGSEFFLS